MDANPAIVIPRSSEESLSSQMTGPQGFLTPKTSFGMPSFYCQIELLIVIKTCSVLRGLVQYPAGETNVCSTHVAIYPD